VRDGIYGIVEPVRPQPATSNPAAWWVAVGCCETDQHCFWRIATDHPDVLRLRELSRTEFLCAPFAAGVLSRKYSEMKLTNLSGAGQALRQAVGPDKVIA
jgi:hypothetical protein